MPEDWDGQNVNELLTLFEAYIPTDQVDTLAAQLKALNSPFYNQPTAILRQFAAQVDGSYPLTGATGGSGGGGGSGPGSYNDAADGVDNSRRNAIIGVCSAIGGALLIALGYWFFRHMRNREHGHRRMSQFSGGVPPTMPLTAAGGYDHENPFTDYGAAGVDQRRRRDSFFFAEDSLRGYEAVGEYRGGEETFHRTSPDMTQRARAPIVPSHISAPILRESSLNW